jgi:hypothetical protein|tara:strand:+ start:857 stop:1033 length:177 start_codon:yes stop_codon:yes gene_type:complete
MEERLFKIQELSTVGWEDVVEDDNSNRKLTKEQCNAKLQGYLGIGIAPDRLRAVVDND